MGWGKSAALCVLAGAPLLLAGCLGDDIGYVEVKLAPGYLVPQLAIESTKIEMSKNGSAVLKQPVGKVALQFERDGRMIQFCEVEVRKNRIVTVTVTAIGRDARCRVQG